MVNQQLLDYINQQKSSGVGDLDLRTRLIDSWWPPEDVQAAMGHATEPEKKPQAGAFSMYDSNTPGMYELGVVGPANGKPEVGGNLPAEGSVTVSLGVKKDETSSNRKKGGWVLVAGMVVLAGLGLGFWVVSSRQTIISPLVIPTPVPDSAKIDPLSKFGQATQSATVERYENVNLGFSVKPPKGWLVNDSGAFGTLVVFTNPVPDTEASNKFTSNMNVVAEDTNQTLEAYVEASKDLLAQNFTNHVLMAERSVAVATGSGTILESTFDQGIFKLHNLQLVYVTGGKAFVVTAVCLDSNWDSYKQLFEDALVGFQVK